MFKKKNYKLYITLITIISLILIPSITEAKSIFSGSNYSLRESNGDLILSFKPEFEPREIDILKFKGYDNKLKDVEIRKDFIDKENRLYEYDDQLLKTGKIPHILLNGPLEIETLADNIWFETLILNKENNKFNYTGYYYFIEGSSIYKIYDKNNGFQDKTIDTGDEPSFIEDLDKRGISYELIKTNKGGKITSQEGKLNIDGKKTNHNNFLLAGNIRNTTDKIPNILITVDFNGKDVKKDKPKKIKSTTNTKSKFKDVKTSDWYFNDIHELVDKKVLSGYTDGTFRPNDNISFGEFLKAALSSATGNKHAPVKGQHWAKGYYEEAVNLKVMNRSDFKPTHANFDKSISREDMAYILININERVQKSESIKAKDMENEIMDFNRVSSSRKKHVLQAYSKGLIKGKDGKFAPHASTSRGEAAVVLMRLKNY